MFFYGNSQKCASINSTAAIGLIFADFKVKFGVVVAENPQFGSTHPSENISLVDRYSERNDLM